MVMLVMLIVDVYELFDFNVVKLVCDVCGCVLYFSWVLLLWVCDVFVVDC